MLDALIEFVQKAQGEDFEKLCMEDAALCIAWCRSWEGNAARMSQYESVPKIVKTWINTPQADFAHTEGRRHQWVLRELIDELQAGRARTLAWDEVALLTAVMELIELSGTPDTYTRLRTLLTPHAKLLTVQAKSLPPAPGLPTIAACLHVVSSKQVLASRPRDVKVFAGIPVNVRGPVLVHERGHLKILDQVPENCTVVVENGSVSVGGFVLGRVAASQHCEVRENISGMVVVRQGNVRARGIMVRSKVVSKWGSVWGKQAESPDLVFAGTEIRVENTTSMGEFRAPVITVLGDVCGGVYRVTKQLTADRFRSEQNRKLSIVLRQDLTCEDYGENPGPDGLRYLMKANRMKRDIAAMRERVATAQSEAEHAIANAEADGEIVPVSCAADIVPLRNSADPALAD